MKSYETIYGNLSEITAYENYENGRLKECALNSKTVLNTSAGQLIPQFDTSQPRKKNIYSVGFYANGELRKVSLQNQTTIMTPIGEVNAELVMFYESGKIKKVFPLNGKLSGYWSEEDEYALAAEYTLTLPNQKITVKPIAICFYEDGSVQSITLWPKERVLLNTPLGLEQARIGVSFYQSGKIKSFEPAKLMEVVTPIGIVTAYDTNALGINGEQNSLMFNENGKIKALTTNFTKVSVLSSNGTTVHYAPGYQEESVHGMLSFIPLRMEFTDCCVKFNGQQEHPINECVFITERYALGKL